MRKVRYRQILKHRIGDTGHIYKYQVRLQQSFWNEDQASAWTIPQVREIHSSLGTWDKRTHWNSVGWERVKGILTPVKGTLNRILIEYWDARHWKEIYPKANYKLIKKAQEARWKEQEQRTLEFFEREGC